MRKNVERSWKNGTFVKCEVDGIPIRGWGIVVGPYDEAESLVLVSTEGEEEIEGLPMELTGGTWEEQAELGSDFLLRCETAIHEEAARVSQERRGRNYYSDEPRDNDVWFLGPRKIMRYSYE